MAETGVFKSSLLRRNPVNAPAPTAGEHLAAPSHAGKGLIVRNFGGRAGWLARRYFPTLATRAYLFFLRRGKGAATDRAIAAFLRADTPPLFSHLEIETFNRCNGDCQFCPVNRNDDTRPAQLMDESLFASILGMLSEIRYNGYIGLFSNNEPLLDKRLEAFAAEARRRLPHAFLALSSNATLLTTELFRRLLRHFDQIVLNNYRDRPEMHPHIREIHDYCLTPEGQFLIRGKTVEISLRRDSDVLSSRGGAAPNRPAPTRPLAIRCVLPFTQMVVRPDGKTSLCCNDALGKITLGDLRRDHIADVWRSTAYGTVRTAMAEQGRAALPLCRDCDFVKHTIH